MISITPFVIATIALSALICLALFYIRNVMVVRKIQPTIDANLKAVGWQIDFIHSFTGFKTNNIYNFYIEITKTDANKTPDYWHNRTNGTVLYNQKTKEYIICPSSEKLYDLIFDKGWIPDKKSWSGMVN